jgi:hypothetical protein
MFYFVIVATGSMWVPSQFEDYTEAYDIELEFHDMEWKIKYTFMIYNAML